jgi:transcriptional regulator with XRE-family HTH domain
MAASSVSEELLPRILRFRRATAKRLARARARSGLSLTEVAAISGIHKSRWHRYEAGINAIPLELVPLLAAAVNMNVAELVAA